MKLELDNVVEENGVFIVYVKIIETETNTTLETFSLCGNDIKGFKDAIKEYIQPLLKNYKKIKKKKNELVQALKEVEQEVI